MSDKQARRVKGRERTLARRAEGAVVAGVLLISAIAFVNSLDGEFVYDDRFQVLNNPTIDTLGNIPRMFTQGVWQFMDSTSQLPVGSYYRPIFNIVLIINHHLFGAGVFGWHVTSLWLHLIVVSLVYLLCRQWEIPGEASAAAALLFGLHPVHCESVAWVSGLPDPLAAVFVLGSLILYERYCRGALSRWPMFSLCAGLALLAMLCKEVAIVFPVFVAFREWQGRAEQEGVVGLSRVVSRVLPFVAAAVVYIILRYAVLGFITKPEPKAVGVTGMQVLLTIPSVLLSYARMLFLPYPLAITYPSDYVSSPADPHFVGPALAVAGMLIGACLIVRSSKVGQRALVFLLLFLLPVLNLKAFNPQESLIHDRYLYLPSVGFCILVALGLRWLSARFGARQHVFFRTATASIAAILLLLTVNQNHNWQNDLAMANAALKLNPQSPFLLNYIGAYYAQKNQPAVAERNYLEALATDPKYYDALSNLGDIYRVQGRRAEADQAYLKAIEYGAPYADTRYNLGVSYTSQGRYNDAIQPLLEALEIQPSNTSARYNLGWNYDQLGQRAQAEQAYAETLQYKPAYPEPRINLGVLLTKQGRLEEALTQLQSALPYAPDHPILLYALGDVLMKLKRYDAAIAQFKQLANREPANKLVYTSLGLCYEGMGRHDEAKIHFQKAIDIAPQEPYTKTAREHLAKLQLRTS